MLSGCGTVEKAELITTENGMSRGFGFATMSTPEEAQAVIDEFDSYEVSGSGKIMRVDFAKSFKKPDRPPPDDLKVRVYETTVALLKLPFSFTVEDIKTLVSECGTVVEAELPIRRNGINKGVGFVTMSTAEEAQAVIDKFDSYEVSGRVIRAAYKVDKQCVLNAYNLAWEVTSEDLKDFFSPDFRPLSAKVVKLAYKKAEGFVTFATEWEAKAAMFAMRYKSLMDRPVLLRLYDPRKRMKKSSRWISKEKSSR